MALRGRATSPINGNAPDIRARFAADRDGFHRSAHIGSDSLIGMTSRTNHPVDVCSQGGGCRTVHGEAIGTGSLRRRFLRADEEHLQRGGALCDGLVEDERRPPYTEAGAITGGCKSSATSKL